MIGSVRSFLSRKTISALHPGQLSGNSVSTRPSLSLQVSHSSCGRIKRASTKPCQTSRLAERVSDDKKRAWSRHPIVVVLPLTIWCTNLENVQLLFLPRLRFRFKKTASMCYMACIEWIAQYVQHALNTCSIKHYDQCRQLIDKTIAMHNLPHPHMHNM